MSSDPSNRAAAMAGSLTAADALHAQVAAQLRQAGQRYTAGRRALIDVLRRAARPLTTPRFREGRATLPLSSIYRNLVVLEEAGVVRRIVTRDDAARYELAERFTAHHHHLVCQRCGAVLDYEPSAELEAAIHRALASLPIAGFEPGAHHLEVVGRCDTCRTAG